jgi:hypothetical protein
MLFKNETSAKNYKKLINSFVKNPEMSINYYSITYNEKI